MSDTNLPPQAPQQPTQPTYSQPQYAQPQYAPQQPQQPQYAAQPVAPQPQYAQQPGTYPQYAQPQQPGQYYPAGQFQPTAYPGVGQSQTNVLGIVAFALLVLVTLLGFFSGVVYREAMVTYNTSLMIWFPLLRLLLVVAAIVLGALGARMRAKPRLRWMAVGSLVAGSFLAVPIFLSMLSFLAPGLYYLYF